MSSPSHDDDLAAATFDLDDEITDGTLLTHEAEIRSAMVKERLG